MNKYDLIGIGHPVLGFETPRIIYHFIDIIPEVKNKKTFLFKTAADPSSINYGASKRAIRKLKHKGYNIFHESLICMPCNWILKYSDEFSKQLYNIAKTKIKFFCSEIDDQKKRNLKINFFLWIFLVSIGVLEDFGSRFFGKDLFIIDSCKLCKKCIKNCPTDNIVFINNKIKFKWNCIWCMKCIYDCPNGAISPHFFKFCVVKGGYNIRSIINNSKIEGQFITKNTKGYFKHFYDYIYNQNK